MGGPTYRYLDLRPGASAWPGAVAHGVGYDADDRVRLSVVAAEPAPLAASPALAGALAIAVAADGSVYAADPGHGVILEIFCDGSVGPYGCLGPPLLSSPRGVLAGPRDRLYIADAGGAAGPGRVLVVDRATATVVGIWPSLGTPADLAADRDGRLYVVDASGERIVRLDADGVIDASFAPRLPQPRSAATLLAADGQERLVVVCAAGPLVVLGLDGTPDEDAALGLVDAGPATAVAAGDGVVYLATPNGVLAFSAAGAVLGVVGRTTATALTLDRAGRLVLAGAFGAERLTGTGHTRQGHLLLGPLPLLDGVPRWDRVVVQAANEPDQPAGVHTRIWTRTSASTRTPPLPPPSAEPGEQRERTGPDRWRAAPACAPDALVLHEPADYLWVCLELTGDGRATPAVRAVRVDHLGTGLPGRLPAVYAAADTDETAYRLVQLLAAPLDELAAAVDELPNRFDPGAVPVGELARLGEWVAQPLDDRRPEAVRRQAVAEAFARHGTRGTLDHLARVLTEAAGIPVRISEPATRVSLWRLGESPLGARSMLVPAEALGAIVGTTAVTDGSHLIGDEDIGWPLYADVAHRFCVHIMAASLTEAAERALRAVLQEEKPAHTLATVCVTKPGVRVGIGGIGCELVVGGTCPPGRPHSVSASAVVGDRIPVMGKGDR